MEVLDDSDRARTRGYGDRLERLGHIYHYMRFSGCPDRLESILIDSRLWLGPFRRLNDPFEASVPWHFRATDRRIREYWKRFAEENPGSVPPGFSLDDLVARAKDPSVQEGLKRAVHELVQEIGVTCFAELRDDVPMWSYYGDNNQGVCLRFQGPRLLSLDPCFPPIPVTYAKRFREIAFYESTWFRRIEALLATKADAWGHELEWRIVRTSGNGDTSFKPEALDGVILGCRMSAADRALVEDMIGRRQHPTELLRASVGPGYKLTISPG